MLRPRTVRMAQLVSLAAAVAIAWASFTEPQLALRLLGVAYMILGAIAIGAVWYHLRTAGEEAHRCHRCGGPMDRFRSIPFCHACGHRQDAARSGT